VHAVGLFVVVGRPVVVEVTRMFWVTGDVVEMLTQVVCGTRHATPDDARCVGHSHRHRRVSRRCVLVLLGAQRRAIRVSSLELHSLLAADDLPRRHQQRCGHDQSVARHLQTAYRSIYYAKLSDLIRCLVARQHGNHKPRRCSNVI